MQWYEPFYDQGLFVLSVKQGIRSQAPPMPIACFDLDNTLIVSRAGRHMPSGAHDWQWTHPRVKRVLRRLHAEGHGVVVLTNQARFTYSGVVKKRIENVCRDLDLPLLVLVGKAGAYRKPRTEAWNYLCTRVCVDKDRSFFVGDAAGRPGDFSNSDLAFARNAGLAFFTNDAFF